MLKHSFSAMVAILLCILTGYSSSGRGDNAISDDADPTRLAAYIADPNTPFDQKWDAAKAIRRCPPRRVYAAVFTHLGPLPDADSLTKVGVGWDGRNREELATAPPAWQSAILMAQVWYDMAAIAKVGRGAMVAELLPTATNDAQRYTVLTELYWDWALTAEEPVTKIMRDGGQPHSMRISAARALLRNMKKKYYAEIRDTYLADQKLPLAERFGWLQELTLWPPSAPPRPRSDWDPRLLQIVFQILDEPVTLRPVSATLPQLRADPLIYCVAHEIGSYLNVPNGFAPSQNDANYRNPDKSIDQVRFVTATVHNAQKWWADHGQEIMKDRKE